MIRMTVEDAAAAEAIEGRAAALRSRLRSEFAAGAGTLLAIVGAKLSGGVLEAKSGALRAAMRAEMTEDDSGFVARVASDASVPYARIHEYGGRIAIPEIVPKNARALAFEYGGKMVFARRVRAHVVNMPERSYMRSSLAEFAPAFVNDIRKATAEACA